MNGRNINIMIKPSALELWKPVMSISDFQLPPNDKRYVLNKIISQKIRGNSKNAQVSIEYYDARSNKILSTTIRFTFYLSKAETIAMLLESKQFLFNTKKLKTIDFMNFNAHDISANSTDLKITSVAVDDWSVFNQFIIFKINVIIYGAIKKSVLIKKKLAVNSVLLIRKLLTCEPLESLLKINSYLEFEVQRFTPVIKNYHLFFGENDYEKLFSIVKEIEIFNPKILTLDIDVFSAHTLAYFNGAVTIYDQYFKDFIFKSTYDARYLQTLIKTRLLELPLRAKIQGHPRTIDVTLKHVFTNYKRIYLKTVLSKSGISNLFDRNVVIKITDYHFENNDARLEIYFKNATAKSAPIMSRKIKFEKTLGQFAGDKFKNSNFITLNDKTLIDKHPLFLPQVKDFQVAKANQISILAVQLVADIPLQSRWAKYRFQLHANDPTTQITFDYFQDIYFTSSRLEYLFKSATASDLDLNYLTTKSDQYYYELALQFNQTWIPIFNHQLLAKLSLSKRFQETDLKIIKLQFDKTALFKAKLPVQITIWSEILKSSRLIKTSLEIVKKKLLQAFNNLTGSDIKLVNKNIVASYPIPLLDVNDFYTHHSFQIREMIARYNEANSSVACTFVVTLGKRQRIIKNIYYFINDAINRIPKQIQLETLDAFKTLNKNDIIVSYDASNPTYFINPKVNVQAKNAAFYARTNNWSLKSRWRKLVNLNIEVRYCSYSKLITRTIKFKKRISNKDYRAWKEANYDLK